MSLKYRDLIQFDPIVTVIELRSANNHDKARELVRSYVVSDDMADLIYGKIISQLSLDNVIDNKGVLVVGNYGTGKSHLMSAVSGVAEDASMLGEIQNAKFRTYAQEIAGRFEVLRVEIGATSKSLRDIITEAITKDLAKRGISFTFPPESDVTNNKDALNDMMAAFAEVYDDKGYLLIVDELLDYLKSRKGTELMKDVNFMRELGEFIKSSHFRFMSGVQEALFDNPAFSTASKSLLKMKDRYEQALIRSQDIAYVAKQRVLHKTPEQKAMIREYLEPFCKLYSGMSEQMDEFVDLFPIHPAYIKTFQQMVIVEKREVLKTISATIQELINKDLPNGQPGVISYDSYWERIKNDPGIRVEPDVDTVLKAATKLEDIIARSFPKPAYKPTAQRIIAALSVHRLTTPTLDAQVGLTVDNIKDDLCIYLQMPVMDAEFLSGTVNTIVNTIRDTVTGMFIRYNQQNGQYYLDVNNVGPDVEIEIKKEAARLEDDRVNQYYYSVIWDCLDWHPDQYITGHQIYQYNLNWIEKNHYRRGYLFMGNSNDRPTAQPPEDFYVYFLPMLGAPVAYAPKDDEVYFSLKPDKDFVEMVKLYAGARELEVRTAPGETRTAYNTKGKKKLKQIVDWMEAHKTTAFTVTYGGRQIEMLSLLRGVRMDTLNIKTAIDLCAANVLGDWFKKQYPLFPRFSSQITQENQASIRSAAMDAINGKPTKLGTAILEAMSLSVNGKVKADGLYANYYMQKLKELAEGNVLNYSDIMEQDRGDPNEHIEKHFRLTETLTVILLSALVYSGACVLVADDNKRYDASNVDAMVKADILSLIDFKRIEKPKAAPVQKLIRVFDAIGANSGLLMGANTWDAAVAELLQKSNTLSDRTFKQETFLKHSLLLWGESIVPTNKLDELIACLKPIRTLNDDVRSRFNSAPKLKNFDYDDTKIDAVARAMDTLKLIENIERFREMVGEIMQYLSAAETRVEAGTLLRQKFADTKQAFLDMRDQLLDPDYDEGETDDLLTKLEALRDEYVGYYLSRHKSCRLTITEDQRRQSIINGRNVSRMKKLSQLTGILSTGKFNDLLGNQLIGLRVCYNCTETELKKSANAECPFCGYNPAGHEASVTGRLDQIETAIDEMFENWKETLIASLDDPMVKDKMQYMSPELQPLISDFLRTKKYPQELENFVKAVKEAFADYECIEIGEQELIDTIQSWGSLSPDALKQKLTDYIDKKCLMKDKSKVRFAIK